MAWGGQDTVLGPVGDTYSLIHVWASERRQTDVSHTSHCLSRVPRGPDPAQGGITPAGPSATLTQR